MYSEILLAPGSSEPISFTVKDANKVLIDFTVGTWSAYISIIRYPGYLGASFHKTGSPGLTLMDSNWITFSAGKVVVTPNPAVTSAWAFSRYHYDCFLTGPNFNSTAIRIVHGPFLMDL